jgi:hypothetical protein
MTSMHHHGRSGFSDAYLEKIYPMPRMTRSLEEWYRFRHEDLPGLDDATLAREGRRAQWRADLDADPDRRRWLTERVAAVEAERQLRVAQIKQALRAHRQDRGAA